VIGDAAEADLLSSLDALDEALFRMKSVRDASGRVVDFEYEFCNRAALELLGRCREEVLGRRLLDLFPSHRANGLLDAYVRVTETGEPLRLEFAFEEGGVVGEFEIVVARAGDGYLLAGHDISDRKRLERELVALNDQLQNALTSRVVIEQAKGFVAAQFGISPETAFSAIRRYTRSRDLLIGDVARAIVRGDIDLSKG
jgi:PAS domain S-box-containing protein